VTEEPFQLSWDDDARAGYLPLAPLGPGEAAHQRVVGNPGAGLGDLVLDFDAQGRLLGVEFLDRAVTPPGLDPA
jgi:Protein of unknown function (DUF2283)